VFTTGRRIKETVNMSTQEFSGTVDAGTATAERRKIVLVELPTYENILPLASGYIQAYAQGDEAVAAGHTFEIVSLPVSGEREDLLRFQTREIDELNPEPGESDKLAEERERLRHATRLARTAGSAETSGSRAERFLSTTLLTTSEDPISRKRR
jgi:hypothetical protein